MLNIFWSINTSNNYFLFADDFSFFAVFHLDPDASYWSMPEAILSELMSAITDKLKFVVCPRFGCSTPYDVLSGPETLVTAHNFWVRAPTYVKMLLEILNKRWQTLDLKSMMSELQRSSSENVITKGTLPSVHRFKRKEGASLP